MFNKILITGDFSRISNKKIEQEKNIEWLYYMLKTPLEFSTESSIQLFPSIEDRPIVDTLLKEIGITGLESWVSKYNESTISTKALAIIKEIFEDSLVICLEIPNWLERVLSDINCIVLEVIFHPVRFMPDLLLGFASKNKSIDSILESFSVPQFNIFLEANMIKSYNKRLTNSSFFEDSEDYLLITGQMNIDRSLICEYHLKSIYDYKDKLMDYAKEYQYVIYKAHPYMAKNSINREELKKQIIFLKTIFNNVKVTNTDFYWLISQDEIKKNISLSSGTGIESSYFGVESEFLYSYQWSVKENQNNANILYYHGINQSFLYPDFWEKILYSIVKTKKSSFNVSYQKNRLRKTLIQSWGFGLTDLGGEDRIYRIDKENKSQADKNIANVVKNMASHKNYSTLDIEFEKIKRNKDKMKSFLINILLDLNQKIVFFYYKNYLLQVIEKS